MAQMIQSRPWLSGKSPQTVSSWNLGRIARVAGILGVGAQVLGIDRRETADQQLQFLFRVSGSALRVRKLRWMISDFEH